MFLNLALTSSRHPFLFHFHSQHTSLPLLFLQDVGNWSRLHKGLWRRKENEYHHPCRDRLSGLKNILYIMSYKEAIKVTPLPRMQLLCGSVWSTLPVDWTVRRFRQPPLLYILLIFPFHCLWVDYVWIFHLLVKSLCHNIQRRWTVDLPQSDCGLFPLGLVYLRVSKFPFLMVNVFIIKSALSDCFSGPNLLWENQPAEAEQAHEADVVSQKDPIQPRVHTEPRRFLSVWLLWPGQALCGRLDIPVHHGLAPS